MNNHTHLCSLAQRRMCKKKKKHNMHKQEEHACRYSHQKSMVRNEMGHGSSACDRGAPRFDSYGVWNEMWQSADPLQPLSRHRRHTNSAECTASRLQSRHVSKGRVSTCPHAAEGTMSPIDSPSCSKTRQWFLLATETGSTGQNPTSVLWEQRQGQAEGRGGGGQ